jgi:hypothetical protein
MSQSPVRRQIIEYLDLHGSIDDPTGRATARLREAVGYQGSEQGFAQLIASMERARELTRVVKGKRTYRIMADPASSGPTEEPVVLEDPSDHLGMDYEDLAAALLVRVVQTINAGTDQREDEGSWANRRLERLERRIGELERDLSRSKAESKSIADERDDLRRQLEHSEGNLAVLTDRLVNQRPQRGHLLSRLGADEQALLHQLRGSASRASPGRVG